MTQSLPYSHEAHTALQYTYQLAQEKYQSRIEPVHVLLSLCLYRDYRANQVLKILGADLVEIATTCREQIESFPADPDTPQASPSPTVEQAIQAAAQYAEKSDQPYIDTAQLLMGIMENGNTPDSILRTQGITAGMIQDLLNSPEAPALESNPVEQKTIRLPKEDAIPEMPQKFGISGLFLAILAGTILAGVLSYLQIGNPQISTFIFVTGGWIVSLCLHEFGHAAAAYWAGDKTVVGKGYLTLNPLKYTHGFLSIVLPVVIVIMGGIGLPGGAVYLRPDLFRKSVYYSLVSAAGPIANLLVAIGLAIPFWIGLPDDGTHTAFWAGVAFLAFLQITALFFNLLPIPGLDGFGILTPFLPTPILQAVSAIRRFTLLIIFFLFFYDTPARDWFWNTIFSVLATVKIDFYLFELGYTLFQFWR